MFVLKIGLASWLFWIVVLWLGWDFFQALLNTLTQQIPWVGNFEWFRHGVSTLGLPLLGYTLVILTISTATGIWGESVIRKLAARHYPQHPVVGTPRITTSTLLSIKAGVVFLFAFLFTFPLFFVPILGQLWLLWLWSLLIKEPNYYEVSSLFLAERQQRKRHQKGSGTLAIIASIFNLFPVLNLFAPLFGQILVMHRLLGQKDL
jgi:hypothetical protein